MSKTINKNLTTLEEFKEKNYGERGTKGRDELEAEARISTLQKIIELGFGGRLELSIKI